MRALVAVACGAEFLVVLDASVVTVALPAIGTGLGVDAAGLQWVVTAYALVFGGFLLLGGRVADLYGLRRTFLAGLALFVAASAVGGLAVSPTTLVVARAVQGLGAAVLAPAGLTLLTTTVEEGPRRIRALAVWTALASAGGAAGSLLGGVLTDLLSWRATLLVNLPVGVVLLVAAARVLPCDRNGRHDRDGPTHRRLDLVGAVTATAGLVALTFGVSGASERGWTSPATLAALLAAVVLLSVFGVHEARWARTPLVPPRLLRQRPVAVGNVAVLVAGAALMPMWFFLSLRLQRDLGLSPLAAGLGFLPHTLLTVAVGVGVAPVLMRHLPPRVLVVAGCLVTAAGFLWQSRTGVDDGYLAGILAPAVPMAVGGGLLNTPLTTVVTSGVTGGADGDAGAASGLMNTGKQAGGAVGLAALVTASAAAGPSGFAVAFALMAASMVAVAALAPAIPRPVRV